MGKPDDEALAGDVGADDDVTDSEAADDADDAVVAEPPAADPDTADPADLEAAMLGADDNPPAFSRVELVGLHATETRTTMARLSTMKARRVLRPARRRPRLVFIATPDPTPKIIT